MFRPSYREPIRSPRPLAALGLLLVALSASAQPRQILSRSDIVHPVFAANGMVSSQEATATRVGVQVLEQGGNAVDAAVAVGFTLAVTLPWAGNLGGGGFMLVYRADLRQTVAIDFRETAPAAATRTMYLDANGDVDTARARFSYLSVAVPGTVAGLALALERYGTLPLARVIAPAIELAGEGMAVSPAMANALRRWAKRLRPNAAANAIFFKSNREPYRAGDRLVQRDLAWSLRRIAEQGARAFYQGPIAARIVDDMRANGGLVTAPDLVGYRPVVRAPVRGTYRGFEIVSMPPPSSGGVHLIQILNILEGFPIRELGHNGATTIHLMAESMKLAYADRSKYLGDPDFWKVPVRGLVSKGYGERLRAKIDPDLARPATAIAPGSPPSEESEETTHFTVADREGNVVTTTYTLNFGFGTGIVAAGTGILLNNEMDDFSAKPGSPNAYGLLGGEANAIAGGKRPLSSMTPTIVFKDGAPWLATGTPGGSRIITTTRQIILNVIDHQMNIAAATAAPRVHHQWLPDVLRVETGLSPDTLRLLSGRGHRIEVANATGSTQSIMMTEEGFLGASDPRRIGGLAAGF